MIRFYLLTMFALPALELFERWKAKHTEPVGYGGAFNNTGRFGWHTSEYPLHVVSIFHLNVPWLRYWRRSSALANFQLGYVEGWHRLILVHVIARGPTHNVNKWMREWIAAPDCTQVPADEWLQPPP